MSGPAERRRIVHLGLGNFHRAHEAVYTAASGSDWTICGVANRSRHVVQALRRQGMRYTVLTVEDADVFAEEIGVITEALVAADERETVVARIADPATAIVSLTVTEAGYRPDGDLIGLLREGLLRRDGAPVTLLSCDNLAANGAVLQGVLGDLGDLPATFPNTMVDRIVPTTTSHEIELARAAGYDDAVPVPAEPFRQWVIQPRFAADRPAWERAGAVLSDDVALWEAVKVRLLNGTHSLIAYLGLMSGHELIARAIADPAIRSAADALGEEYLPTLTVPAGLDVAGYRSDLLHRFGNAALGHRTGQVGTDGSLKLLQRVPEPARWHLERGTVPPALALTVAAFLCCWCRDVPLAGQPRDPAAERLRELGRSLPEDAALADVAVPELFGAHLAGPFASRVGELLAVLTGHGVPAAVRAVVA